jgi:hypothetical protein
MFYSDAKQDEFVANLLNFSKNGFYVDIGSCGAVPSNNTYFFESLMWNGICIEIDNRYNVSYLNRTCKYVNADALTINYKTLFEESLVPSTIDYLSLDIDAKSVDVLNLLPFDTYNFKIITIEHDAYLYGDIYKSEQNNILSFFGYLKLFENVFVEQHGFTQPNCPFEDWWVHPSFFDVDKLTNLKSCNMYPSEIIKKVKNLC